MSKIYYANLPDVENPTVLMKDSFYKLGQIFRYLSTALRNAKNEVNVLGWRKITKKDEDQESIWVELLDPPSGKDVDGQVYQQFLRSLRIYETEKDMRPYIDVIDRDYKTQQLKLSRLPSTDTIYVHPNTYDLKKQQEALRKLQTIPVKDYRPLLRLLEPAEFNYVQWPEPELIEFDEDSWEFLDNEEFEGIDRQRNFVKKASSTPDFAILEGPPGSGKTTTICELILQIVRRGGRVMLCASTHVAIDNVLEKIKDHNAIVAVRIGDKDIISEKVVDVQLDNIIKTETRRIEDFLENYFEKSKSQKYFYNAIKGPNSEQVIQNIILESANLVCGTSTGILKHPEIDRDLYKAKPLFDYLIIDEASKTTFVEFLVPAMLARKWVFVGDPQQLSPYIDRGRIEGVIRTYLPYSDRRACQTAYWGKNRVNSLIETEDEEFLDKLHQQAEAFEESVLELDQVSAESDLQTGLDILSSRIIVGDTEKIKQYEHLLPSDFGIAEVGEDCDQFKRRQEWWMDEQVDDYSEKNWEAEITWRLIRAHEMRQFPQSVEKYENEIKKLIPVYFNSDKQKELIENIYRTAFIALPSIIETFKEGFQFSRIREMRYPSALEIGLDREEVLKWRYEILSYQHRMHPDISKFPREYVYKNMDALRDPSNMEERRAFPYIRYGSRSEWIDIHVREKMKQFNLYEVDALLHELKLFIPWALENKKIDREPWEIAVITFYRAQEHELRNEVRQYSGQENNKSHFSIGENINITLGTVDSFQGREADVVFLSFCRNRKVGFLNSINRLNVAITRAKYQLVMFGDKRFFQRAKNGYLLNDLAHRTLSTLTWGEN